jgi:hypothetical protein
MSIKLRTAGVVTAVALAMVAAGCAGKPARSLASRATPSPTPPPVCPLTGALAPGGQVPVRPALAVKVENLPESRPPTGLQAADIVYEEPVEEGITRFIVIYQCRDAAVVEPVRSGRLVDADVLAQFGRPLFAYAGGIGPTLDKIRSSNLVDLSFISDLRGYRRDPSRVAPHNLIAGTPQLYARAGAQGGAPGPVFTYSATPAPGVAGMVLHVPFSSYSDVTWRWNAISRLYQRSYGIVPALLSDGSRISAANAVVQFVSVTPSPYVEDPTGSHQNFVRVTGTGRAIVCRAGTCVGGTWNRPTMKDITTYLDVTGHEVGLSPGPTWVELAPSSTVVTHA